MNSEIAALGRKCLVHVAECVHHCSYADSDRMFMVLASFAFLDELAKGLNVILPPDILNYPEGWNNPHCVEEFLQAVRDLEQLRTATRIEKQ